MRDQVLDRILYEPGARDHTAIPWPTGTQPTPDPPWFWRAGAALPRADVLVVTWTAAEAEALATVLTPGVQRLSWVPYTKNWLAFVPRLTGRSPAASAGRLASYWPLVVDGVTVLAVKSELHLATDDDTAPIVDLWKQMVADAQPSLILTTGTAGGIGSETVLGDVSVSAAARFNCQRAFKDQPWAQARYESTAQPSSDRYLGAATRDLIPLNAAHLRPVATRDPVVWTGGDVETVDFFGFDDTDDSYGIRAADSIARVEEMDDATLPLALSQLGDTTPWLSVRNASDPQVPSSEGTLEQQATWASAIYRKYGYWSTIGSALVCWAAVADLV